MKYPVPLRPQGSVDLRALTVVAFDLLEKVHRQQDHMNEWLRGALGGGAQIDEVALLFHDQESLSNFVRVVVQQEGYELFNSASDIVSVHPLGSSYGVDYWFLRTPYAYRLELMQLTSPGSPLHEYLLSRSSRWHLPVPVHASFKCPTEDAYATAVHTLRREGLESVQLCRSSYGTFSYWQEPTATGVLDRPLYVKPRVNLRDMAEVPGE